MLKALGLFVRPWRAPHSEEEAARLAALGGAVVTLWSFYVMGTTKQLGYVHIDAGTAIVSAVGMLAIMAWLKSELAVALVAFCAIVATILPIPAFVAVSTGWLGAPSIGVDSLIIALVIFIGLPCLSAAAALRSSYWFWFGSEGERGVPAVEFMAGMALCASYLLYFVFTIFRLDDEMAIIRLNDKFFQYPTFFIIPFALVGMTQQYAKWRENRKKERLLNARDDFPQEP